MWWKTFAIFLNIFSLAKTNDFEECDCQFFPQNSLSLAESCNKSVFMELIDFYIQSQCDIEDPCGRPTPRVKYLNYIYNK